MSIIGTIHEDVTTDVLGPIGPWQWLVTIVSAALMGSSFFDHYQYMTLLTPSPSTTCVTPEPIDEFNGFNSSLCIVANSTGQYDCDKWHLKFMGIIWINRKPKLTTNNTITHMTLLTPSPSTMCVTSEPIDEFNGFNSSLCIVANSTGQYDCVKWHLKFMGIIWINRKWTIYCQDKMQLLAMAMVDRLGAAFGCIIFGVIADSFGRKKAMQLGLFLELPVRLIITFCDSEGWFRLLVFLRSLLGGATVYMGLLLTCEIASNSWRSRLMFIAALPRVVASVCSVSLVNALPNVATLNFIACLYTGCLVFALRCIPESPQWSIFNRKISSAEKVLYEAAKKNNINLCSDFKIRPVNHRAYECLDEVMSCLGILTTRNVRITVTIAFTLWGLFNFLWCSLYLTVFSQHTPRNIFGPTLCCGILLGCLTILLLQRVKLRLMLFVSVVMTGVFTSAFLFTDDSNEFIRTFISTVAVTSGLLAHCLILNITQRLFAIEVRATMAGACRAFGQIAAMTNYLVISMEAIDRDVLTVVILLFTVSLSFICFVLPDVDGRELPDVLEDMDFFLELSKPLRWATQKTHSPSIEEVQIRVYSFGSGAREPLAELRRPPSPLAWRRLWNRTRNLFRPTFIV